MRLVVTGRRKDGKSVFVTDREVPGRTLKSFADMTNVDVWGSDDIPVRVASGERPEYVRFFPPEGGFRVQLFTAPPDSVVESARADHEQMVEELQSVLPGWLEDAHPDPDDPRFHATDTVDVGICVGGQAQLELDDGATAVLRPGDVYVQNGTRHRWSNTGDEPFQMLVFLVGLRR